MRWMAPRGRVRLDAGWRHAYPRRDETAAGPEPPEVPFAVYLGDEQGRMRTLVFDLDAHGDDGDGQAVAAVWADAEPLIAWLDEAGLDYYVCRSGPEGGVHVWVPVSGEQGLEAAAAARLGRAAARVLPTLDISCLHPDGLVRPPGSPHRHGGRAQLLYPLDPADALTVCDTQANMPAAFERLATLLGADDDPEQEETGPEPRRRIDRARQCLMGRPAPMPAIVRQLLDTPPAADASAHLARILPRLALARWSRADIERLVGAEPDAPGLQHLRSRRIGRGRRPRSDAEAQRVLAHQWQRALEFAAALAPPAEPAADAGPGRAAVQELAAAVAARVADPAWWSPQAGPADRLALEYTVAQAQRCGSAELDLDIRRVALGTGLGRSTAARALGRLTADGRLELLEDAAGTRARRYRIMHPDHWPDTRAHQAHQQGGTQGEPAPAGAGSPEALTARLTRASHDAWAISGRPGGPRGLGHHREATHTALAALHPPGSRHLYNVKELVKQLSARTGYTPAITRAHLRTLVRYGLATEGPTPVAVTDTAALEAAAATLGTTGTVAERARRYAAESQAWAAWCTELERLRAPAVLGRARRTYPRTADGLPDHAAARRAAWATAA